MNVIVFGNDQCKRTIRDIIMDADEIKRKHKECAERCQLLLLTTQNIEKLEENNPLRFEDNHISNESIRNLQDKIKFLRKITNSPCYQNCAQKKHDSCMELLQELKNHPDRYESLAWWDGSLHSFSDLNRIVYFLQSAKVSECFEAFVYNNAWRKDHTRVQDLVELYEACQKKSLLSRAKIYKNNIVYGKNA